MPLKSVFLPEVGLQREEVPAHLIWEDIKYDRIVIRFSNNFKIKKVFNTTEKEIEKDTRPELPVERRRL